MPVDRALFLTMVASIASCRPGEAPAVSAPAEAPSTASSPNPATPTAPLAPAAASASSSAAQPAPSATSASPPPPSPMETFLGGVKEPICHTRERRTEGNPHVPLTPMDRACLAIRTYDAPGGPACEGVEPWCSELAQGLRAPLARRALTCLQAKSGTPAICPHGIVGKCVESVTTAAPVRDDARKACEARSTACAAKGTPLDVGACGRVLSSLDDCGTLGLVASCLDTRCSVEDCLIDLW